MPSTIPISLTACDRSAERSRVAAYACPEHAYAVALLRILRAVARERLSSF